MSITDRFKSRQPVDIQVSMHGWDSDSQSDVPTGLCTLIFWLPMGGNKGKEFTVDCPTPEFLWNTLRDVTDNPLEFFKDQFDYTPPTGTASLPVNLEDLFK